jgi:DNA-binding transcriptional ArsR family regulator
MKKATMQVFELLSHRNRLKLVELLGRKQRTVEDLCAIMKLSYGTVYPLIAQLRDAGVIVTEREGRTAYHSLNHEALRAAIDDLTRSARL